MTARCWLVVQAVARRAWRGAWLAALTVAAGCADPVPHGADGGPPDGTCEAVDATAFVPGRLVVATEQYGSGGGITVIDLATQQSTINVALTSDDVTPRYADGRLWVLNRYGADNVMILDGDDYHLERQLSVRPGADAPCNPHDLLLLSTCRAYLTCFEKSAVYIVDPTAADAEIFTGQIDLSSLADADGVPEVSHLARVQDLVYAAVERLDRTTTWGPVAPSYVAVIDPAGDALVDSITLQGTNPVGPLHALAGTTDLLVAVAGQWDGADAGLERIATATRSASTLITADTLGGVPSALALGDDGCGFAVVTAASGYDTGVVRFCLDGTVAPCLPLGARAVSDVALTSDGRLWVTDRDPQHPGIRVYDAATCAEVTTAPIATGFAPGFTNPLLLIPAQP